MARVRPACATFVPSVLDVAVGRSLSLPPRAPLDRFAFCGSVLHYSPASSSGSVHGPHFTALPRPGVLLCLCSGSLFRSVVVFSGHLRRRQRRRILRTIILCVEEKKKKTHNVWSQRNTSVEEPGGAQYRLHILLSSWSFIIPRDRLF
jgi:hypothetical protein